MAKRMWDEKELIKIAKEHGGEASGASKEYVNEQDAATLASAKAYTDESVNGLAAMSEVENAVNDEKVRAEGVEATKQNEITETNKLSASLVDGLGKVATTNLYDDLTNIPTFAAVAYTGSYQNLKNTPIIPTVDVTKAYVNEQLATKQDSITTSNKLNASLIDGLAAVATTGSYDYLTDKPTNLVTTDTNQDISGYKTFKNETYFESEPAFTSGSICIKASADSTDYVRVTGDGAISCQIGEDEYRFSLPSESGELATTDALDAKQDKLTAGANITISADNVISATSGSSGSTVTGTKDGDNWTTITIDGTEGTIPQAPTDYVTTDTEQEITGKKTFVEEIEARKGISVTSGTTANMTYGASSLIGYRGTQSLNLFTIAIPAKDGTMALTSDIPDVSSYITKDVDDLSNYTKTSALLEKSTETWTFTLSDGSTVTKTIVLGE